MTVTQDFDGTVARPLPNLDLLVPQESTEDDLWTWATITSVGPLRVKIDGEANPLGMTPETLERDLVVNDRVWVQMRGRRVIVHGKSNSKSGPLVLGANLNNAPYISEGCWYVDDATIANSLINWPIEAIPRADKADANNAVGSYRIAPWGFLTTKAVSGARVIQTVETYADWGGGRVTMTYTRTYASPSWGKWSVVTPSIPGVVNETQRRDLLRGRLLGACSPATPARFSFLPQPGPLQNAIAFEQSTWDGVQVYREATGIRQTSPQWQAITLQGAWANYGVGYDVPRAIRLASGWIMLEGLIAGGSPGSVIGVLPQGMRPSYTYWGQAMAANGTSGAAVTIAPDGTITLVASTVGGAAGWLNLSNLRFLAADVAPYSAWTPLTIVSPWTDYYAAAGPTGPTAPTCAYFVDSLGRVAFRGLVKLATGGEPGADSPFTGANPAFAVTQQVHFPLGPSSITSFASGHCTANGTLYWKTGNPGSSGWFSLCNVVLYPVAAFPDAQWVGFSLTAPWVRYSTSFPAPSVFPAMDGMYELRGLIGGGAANSTIAAAFSASFRRGGNGRAIHTTSATNTAGRVDLGTDLTVTTAGTTALTWVTMDGIHYFTES